MNTQESTRDANFSPLRETFVTVSATTYNELIACRTKLEIIAEFAKASEFESRTGEFVNNILGIREEAANE